MQNTKNDMFTIRYIVLLSILKFLFDQIFIPTGISYQLLIFIESIILLLFLHKYSNFKNSKMVSLFNNFHEKSKLTNLQYYFRDVFQFVNDNKIFSSLLLSSFTNVFKLLQNIINNLSSNVNILVPSFLNSDDGYYFIFSLLLFIRENQCLINYLYCIYFVVICVMFKNNIDFKNYDAIE
ncbi:hypothetical protein ACMZ6Y_05630 [Streptococcus pluranimalium]|nr:hypothetical protein [Streptococcus suis]HEL2527754.1 hypothetical protein [Streptococcus suis]HEL2701645.1 hypothetical protein [Streptococcus suis]HEL2702376.1 hypothetical protein [Streptococcus suis]HEM4043725.1 hypothetical protein [Streptococcus suis]